MTGVGLRRDSWCRIEDERFKRQSSGEFSGGRRVTTVTAKTITNGRLGLGERLEEPTHLLLRHPDAGVRHGKGNSKRSGSHCTVGVTMPTMPLLNARACCARARSDENRS
jgi:hypothetical protein